MVAIAVAVALTIGVLSYRALGLPGSRPPAAVALTDPPGQAQLRAGAAAAVAKMASMYDAGSNKATRSWRAANLLGALIGYMQDTGSRAYLPEVTQTYRVHPGPRAFLNWFYDDEGWWALTWIRAYDLTGDPRYLARAETIFADLTRGWTRACGGGLKWRKAGGYKDAISNELFLQIAAELAARVPARPAYRRWALREWAWFAHSGMLRPSGLVVDGLHRNCTPVLDSPLWTYNQGMLIGGLVALERVTHHRRLLALARRTAHAVIASPRLSPGGILHEPCRPGPACGADAPTFKGIFAANLALLGQVGGGASYRAYLLRNAQSLWVRDRHGAAFGLQWAGPFDMSDPARQISAVDLLLTQVPGPARAASGQALPAAAFTPSPRRGP
jgi:predicted alpha-1,6-mannanase (GH76 family)